MFLKHTRSAFWRGFADGLGAPYLLFGKRKSYVPEHQDLLERSWGEVGQVLRGAMAQESCNEQTPSKAPKRAA